MRALLAKSLLAASVAALPASGTAPGALMHADAEAPGVRADLPAAAVPDGSHSFYFARAAYSGVGGGLQASTSSTSRATDPQGAWSASDWCGGGFCAWATDYPKAERQFLSVVRRLTNLNAYPSEHAVRFDDPELRRFPLAYAVEVGYMRLTDDEVSGLRDYLLAGGILVVDDFWGSREWRSFEAQMLQVLPDHRIVDIPMDHPIFNTFYDIEKVVQVPNVGQGVGGGPTHERDGIEPKVRGIADKEGRLMVIINWNTDLGDGWEWAERPDYPLEYSTYAYRMGVNFIVYALSR